MSLLNRAQNLLLILALFTHTHTPSLRRYDRLRVHTLLIAPTAGSTTGDSKALLSAVHFPNVDGQPPGTACFSNLHCFLVFQFCHVFHVHFSRLSLKQTCPQASFLNCSFAAPFPSSPAVLALAATAKTFSNSAHLFYILYSMSLNFMFAADAPVLLAPARFQMLQLARQLGWVLPVFVPLQPPLQASLKLSTIRSCKCPLEQRKQLCLPASTRFVIQAQAPMGLLACRHGCSLIPTSHRLLLPQRNATMPSPTTRR